MQVFWQEFQNLVAPNLLALIVLGSSALVGWGIKYLLVRWLKLRSRTHDIQLTSSILRRLQAPSRWLFPFLILIITEPLLGETGSAYGRSILHHFATLGFIFSAAWFLVRGTYLMEDYLIHTYSSGKSNADEFRLRRIRTQLQYSRRVSIMVILVLAVAFMLLSFDSMRQVGAGLLTSAGVAGVIVGFAAQQTLSNLLAGFQIAFTQPIRLDDVVIVENEWGKIDEITLTYVTVLIWDQRHLILPITYFTQKPFQNWTRSSHEILGTVYLHTDYRMPIEPIRQQLQHIVEASTLWDGRVQNVLVTNLTEHSMEVRALVSAASASALWDLRCHVREELIKFIQREHPQYLPTLRASLTPAPENHAPLQ